IMAYQLFLQTLLQLSSKGTAVISLENGTIYIHPIQGKNTCRISMPLFEGEGYIPSDVRACVSSNGTLHWQKTGAHLQLNASTHTISLVDEIHIQEDKYIAFKKNIHDFIHVSQEWQEILTSLK